MAHGRGGQARCGGRAFSASRLRARQRRLASATLDRHHERKSSRRRRSGGTALHCRSAKLAALSCRGTVDSGVPGRRVGDYSPTLRLEEFSCRLPTAPPQPHLGGFRLRHLFQGAGGARRRNERCPERCRCGSRLGAGRPVHRRPGSRRGHGAHRRRGDVPAARAHVLRVGVLCGARRRRRGRVVCCSTCLRWTPRATTCCWSDSRSWRSSSRSFPPGSRSSATSSGARWVSIAMLLVVVMPLTILAIALFGMWAMGLSFGAALLLGAVLAPTDPVLAGDVGLSGSRRRGNRGAAPVAAHRGRLQRWTGLAVRGPRHLRRPAGRDRMGRQWLAADLLYGAGAALALGAAAGFAAAAALTRARNAALVSPRARRLRDHRDGPRHLRRHRSDRRLRPARRVRRRLHVPPLRVRPRDAPGRPPRRRGRRQDARTARPADARNHADHGRSQRPRHRRLAARTAAAARHSPCPRVRHRRAQRSMGRRAASSSDSSACAASPRSSTPPSSSKHKHSNASEQHIVVWTTIACVVTSIVVHGLSATPLTKRWLGTI